MNEKIRPQLPEAKAIAQFVFRDNYTPVMKLRKRVSYCVRIFDDRTWEVTNADGDGDGLEILQQGYWDIEREGAKTNE